MKKLLLMASAICMGLLSSINVPVAHAGQSACAFNDKRKKKAGFDSGCYYNSACIRQLLSRLNVRPRACTNIASCQYRYVCSEYHMLATNKLIPNRGPTIYWHTSKPF